MTKIILSFLVSLLSSSAFADAITSNQKMQLGDSVRLYEALLPLGHTAEPDPNNSDITVLRTGFSSLDKAFVIRCERRIRGLDLGTECEVIIDSSLSRSGITSVVLGVIGEVRIVTIDSAHDVQALKRSVASPLGWFQSTEKMQAKLPNGKLATFPRLRVDCKTKADSCEISLFPVR